VLAGARDRSRRDDYFDSKLAGKSAYDVERWARGRGRADELRQT
jgi:hypothetical protein